MGVIIDLINEAVAENHLDDACCIIQDAFNVTAGDIASIHFSGHTHLDDNNTVQWRDADREERIFIIAEYMKTELSFLDLK